MASGSRYGRLPGFVARMAAQLAAPKTVEVTGPQNAAGDLVSAWLGAKIAAASRIVHGFIARGTPARLHWIVDRAARKARARLYARQVFDLIRERGVPFWHLSSHGRVSLAG